MPMTLSSSRKASLAVSKVGDTFSGPSDRLVPSVNTLTGKVGVDKKHNSFARYLARKTGLSFVVISNTAVVPSNAGRIAAARLAARIVCQRAPH